MTTASSKTSVEQKGRQLTITRTFDAPRALVFGAYADCESIKRWWGPREWPTTKCTMDFRPGGKWHYCMSGPDGQESWGLGLYKEIVEPERIVYTDAFSDSEGNVNADMPQSLITLEFDERGGKTTLTSRSEYSSEDDVKTLLEMGMVEGISETFDRLDEYLSAVS
jgi:uncharacterized protein YndB with AHSA1/START domain